MEAQFLYQLQVPINCLQYWINKNRIFGLLVCKKVSVGAALSLKQLLTKTHKMTKNIRRFS